MLNNGLRIGIVAGEPSGDALGASIIRAIKAINPNVEIVGIGGKQLIKEGCNSLYPIDKLTLMGLIEPILHLPELIKIRFGIQRYFINNPPDIFIGVDAPDFNLGLEESLKKRGIKTAHVVSPSVWAWRKNRIHKIKRAVDLMLTLLPFEVDIYQEHDVPVEFIGHPLADQIPLESDKLIARKQLNLAESDQILAVLPGSRKMEINYLTPVFIETCKRLLEKIPDLKFITAMANNARRVQFENIINKMFSEFPITIFDEQAQTVMAASDAILISSGTATLEAALIKRPMVIAYKFSVINYWLLKPFIKIPFFGLPNLIAGKRLSEEYLEYDAVPEKLTPAVLKCLNDKAYMGKMINEFHVLHEQIRQNSAVKAAKAILKIIPNRS